MKGHVKNCRGCEDGTNISINLFVIIFMLFFLQIISIGENLYRLIGLGFLLFTTEIATPIGFITKVPIQCQQQGVEEELI